MRHIFTIYHPAVIFIYISAAILCSMLTMQPVYILLSLIIGSIYSAYLNGIKSYFGSLKFMLVMFVIIAAANPLFNHRGQTALFKIGNNYVTFEALFYGLCAGGMLLCILVWFQCFRALITNDKFLYLFGKILPTAALVVSMILGLIPQMSYKAKSIQAAQKGLGETGSMKKRRLRQAVRISGILMSWSLEDGIDTADSMRARGYGTKKRSSFSNFKMGAHDWISLILISASIFINIFFIFFKANRFSFYPYLHGLDCNIFIYLCYGAMLFYPLILEAKECVYGSH